MTDPRPSYEDLMTRMARDNAVHELRQAEEFYRVAGPQAVDARRARDRALANYHEAHRNRVLFLADKDAAAAEEGY